MTSKPRTTPYSTDTGQVRLKPVLLGLSLIFGGFVGATQFIASKLAYQDALGAYLFRIGKVRFYEPFGWARWFIAYHRIEHPVLDAAFKGSALIIFACSAVGVVAALFYRHVLTRDLQVATPDLHGSAHFATPKDIEASGLKGNSSGVYVGGWLDDKTGTLHYLRHDGPEHVEVTAPTRSGKGVSLILPTLYGWTDSVVVHDIKGEAWALTAGFRKSVLGQTAIRFDPTDPSGLSAAFNPIEEIRLGTEYEVGDAQNIAAMVVDPDGHGMTDHWAKTGHELLSAGILHVLYSERNKTLRGLVSFFCDPSKTMEAVAETMLTTEHDAQGQYGWLDPITNEVTRVHPMIAEAARSFLNKSENERSGVQSTAMSFLTIYRDPIVAKNTERSDFRIDDLMNGAKPVSLYIVNKPSDKSRIKPLIRLLMSQIIRTNVRKMEFAEGRAVRSYKHRLLWLHDECSSTGRIEVLEDALPYMAGYGIKGYLIWQDKAQKNAAYGDKESVSGQTHIRIAFAPNTIETAKWLSDMLGTSTRVKQSYTFSGNRNRSTMGQMSTQVQEVSRPLMTADEVMRLPGAVKDSKGNITQPGEMLVMISGQPPIRGTQILYFLDPTFNERSLIPPPPETDRTVAHPPATASGAAVQSAPVAPVATAPAPAADQLLVDDPSADQWESPPLPEHALITVDDDELVSFQAPAHEPDELNASDPADEGVVVSDDDEEMQLGAELIFDPTIELPDDEDDEELAEDDDAAGESAAADEASRSPAYEQAEALHNAAQAVMSAAGQGDSLLASMEAWAAGADIDALPPLQELAEQVENQPEEAAPESAVGQGAGAEISDGFAALEAMLADTAATAMPARTGDQVEA